MRRMHIIATSLLFLMAAIYVAAAWFQHLAPWLPFVRAFAEAGMVGALADWFAVVVLFRHPLGIPIPHTAIIPHSRVRIGGVLGRFVVANFLTEKVIREHFIDKIDTAGAFAELIDRNASVIAAETVSSLPRLVDGLKDEDVRALIRENVLPRFKDVNLSAMVGGLIGFLTHGDSFERLLDEGLGIGKRLLRRNLPGIRRYIQRELPSFWPEIMWKRDAANSLARLIVGRLREQIEVIEDDADHAVRKSVQRRLRRFVDNLATSDEYRTAVAGVVDKVVANPAFTTHMFGLWQELRRFIETSLSNPDDTMKARIESTIRGISRSIHDDSQLHHRMNAIIEKSLLAAVTHFAPDVQAMIEKTVGGWSERQIVETLEPAVGRDLQFIRINGTLVGGLAGLAIYTLSLLIPH